MKNIIFICVAAIFIALTAFCWLNTSFRYIVQGNAYLNSNKVAKAVEILEEGLGKYPENYHINFKLVKAYTCVGDTEQANKITLSRLVNIETKKDKDYQDLLLDLAEMNYREGKYDLAVKFSKKYLETLDEKEVSKRVVMNYIRISQILLDRSIEILEKAFNIAGALNNQELKESIKAVLMPKYFQMANSFLARKMHEEALEILQKGKVLGKSAELNYRQAVIYSEIGNVRLAQNHFDEALLLDPENDDYKITYAKFLKQKAQVTSDSTKKNAYYEKIKLLLEGGMDDIRKTSLLSKIIGLNGGYKVTSSNLGVTVVGEYLYPYLSFRIKPLAEGVLKKYKIIFFDENKNELDIYEAPFAEDKTDQIIEVTCRNPIGDANLVKARLYVNDELVKEYSNK